MQLYVFRIINILTSSSLLIFFLLLGIFGSNFSGKAFTNSAAVSEILWIWESANEGVSCNEGELDCG